MKRKGITNETVTSLNKFFDITDQSLLVFGEGVRNYVHHDMAAINGNLQSIMKIQTDASLLSREIHAALFSNSLSMGLQGDIFRLHEQMSHIVDMVSNCLFQFEIERPNIPSILNQDYLKLMELSSQSLVHAIDASKSFFKDVELIPEKVRRVNFFQKEAARQATAIKKKVFQQMNDLKLSEKTHLRYFALHIEELALQAIKVADQLSVMAIRLKSRDAAYKLPLPWIVAIIAVASIVTILILSTNGIIGQTGGLVYASISMLLLFAIALLYLRERKSRRSSGQVISAQEDEITANSRKLSQMEAHIMSMENDHLQNLLELKRKETTDIAEKITEQKDFLSSVYNLVAQAQEAEDGESRAALFHEIKTKLTLRNNVAEDEDFYSKVEALHQDFSARLEARFPQLTLQERKLATLLRLEFSSKYIATLLNISTKSVEVERHRLRKKMGLVREQNLTEFIKTI
ncbi:MAG: hypothetical protein HUJ93_06235 [Bacteroidales bacterium]|nr:hypothetical protein [Bacteroidales bacterium]